MTSRVKKLFHRKKDDGNTDQAPAVASRPSRPTGGEAGFRTSLYEDAVPGAMPQAGDLPVKGNDSSVLLQAGRKSSVRSMRSFRSRRSSIVHQNNVPYSSSTPTQYDTERRTPRMSPPLQSQTNGGGHYDPHQQESQLSQEFSALNFGGGQGPTVVTQTVTTTHSPHHVSTANRGAPQAQPGGQNLSMQPPLHGERSRQGISQTRDAGQPQVYGSPKRGVRMVNDDYSTQRQDSKPYWGDIPSSERSGDLSSARNTESQYHTKTESYTPVPRKDFGSTSSNMSPSSVRANNSRQQNDIRSIPAKPLFSTPAEIVNDSQFRRRPVPGQNPNAMDTKGEDIVKRAHSSTQDTDVRETVAPAVVHETVHKDIHHVREEAITKEIHNHDVYHRILPIVDVEVLPPRHFLPVEGGGLVEVSASEVPGRGSNWVIAETASKIPSDQVAPKGRRPFTARQFPGREGDAIKYTTPEGHVRTEQSWVHWPELEDGARLTGQSWPMVFGDGPPEKGTYGYSSPKSSKKKDGRKRLGNQADEAY